MLILIAGPYRSGTNDVPELMAQNLARLERAALGFVLNQLARVAEG